MHDKNKLLLSLYIVEKRTGMNKKQYYLTNDNDIRVRHFLFDRCLLQ